MTLLRPVVEVEKVSKTYRIFRRPIDLLKGLISGRQTWTDHHALRDVSLSIGAGESVGLVGRNGAGKSTLLKIIAGTLQPSSGTVRVSGRSAAILELGLGFHPAFSGRENIYLGGLCLGLTRSEIDERFDDIVAFSEIGDALERAFGTYSTGMQARLSFSVASSVDAQLMIVDEALSVGDARFQLKCFNRFQEMRANGASFILVSHSMPTIMSFCDRAILIEGGQIVEDGAPQQIDRAYQKLLFHSSTADQVASAPQESTHERFGSGEGRIVSVAVLDAENRPTSRFVAGEPFALEARIAMRSEVEDLVVGFLVRTPKGIDLFGVDNTMDRSYEVRVAAGGETCVRLTGRMNLASGEYFLTVGVAHRDGRKIDLRYDAAHLTVVGTERQYTTSLVFLDHAVTVTPTPATAGQDAVTHNAG
jgi:lipopolysaccharide transport system ATP-binding protein